MRKYPPFKVLLRSAIKEDGSLWFPTRLTQDWLDFQRGKLGPYLFSSQFLNQHIAPEDRRFPEEWIQRGRMSLESNEGHHSLILEDKYGKVIPVYITTTIDPAISSSNKSDYTAIVTVATDPYDNWFILSAKRLRGGGDLILDAIIQETRTWCPAVLGIETVAFQRVLKDMLLDRLKQEGIVVAVKELQSGSRKGKRVRIEALVPKFAAMKVVFSASLGPELEQEVLGWSPKTELPHDDLIDALSHQLDVAMPSPIQGQRVVSGDWFDLSPEERQAIRRAKERRAKLATSGITTGYGD